MDLLNCYRLFFENTHQCHLVITPEGHIRHANNAALALLELDSLNDLLALDSNWFLSLFYEQKKIQKLNLLLKKTGKADTACITINTNTNTKRCISLEMLSLTCDSEELHFYTFQDRTKHEEEKKAYYDACMRDHRTGAYNERFFETELNNYHCQIQGTSKGYAILTIDIDKFKSLNDSYGHPTADLIIREFVERLSDIMRKTDVFARTGGDEFCILMKSISKPKDTDRLITKIFSAIDAPFDTSKGELKLTISVGIALYPHNGASPEEIVEHADSAMFCSKKEKGNTFSLSRLKDNTTPF